MSGGERKEYSSLKKNSGSPGQYLAVRFCQVLRKSGLRRIDINGTVRQRA